MRAPFLMKASRAAVLRCDGKFVKGGRASFVWETFLMRRTAGVPGRYEIRGDGLTPGLWHKLDWSMDEAQQALGEWGTFGPRHVRRCLRTRASRTERGLPVG